MKHGTARLAFLTVLALVSSCGEQKDGHLTIQLLPLCEPSFAELQSGIASYCVSVESMGTTIIGPSCSSTLQGVGLKVDEDLSPVRVMVEGRDNRGRPVARGRSVPFDLVSGEENVLAVPFVPLGSFALVAANRGGCTQLPYAAAHHTATVFPSGHVLVVGSSSRDLTPQQAAFLIDPVTGRAELISTPITLHRRYHSATLLDDGRVIVLGGEDPVGGNAQQDLVMLRGAQPMLSDYNQALAYPGLLRFEVLPDLLKNPRGKHDAALFHGNQVLVNDGQSPAEMFLGAVEQSDYIVNLGGISDPFPLASGRTVTVVPRDLQSALILGAEANHNGLLSVSQDSRNVNFQPYNQPASPRDRPRGVHRLDGRALFLGGKALVVPESPVLVLDPGPLLWGIAMDERAFPQREYTASLLDDGRVFVLGGASSLADFIPGSTFFIEGEGTDPGNWRAVPGPSLRMPRWGHAAALLPDGRLLVIGGYSANTSVASHQEVATSAEVIAF